MNSMDTSDCRLYNMYHPRRGKGVIFNHLNFEPDLKLSCRTGTEKDADDLERTLKGLDFDVTVHQDMEFAKLKTALVRLASEDHTDADCLFIAVMTHGGDMEKMYAKDIEYTTDIFWETFTATNSPTLAGKPKIFLIQACRGNKTNMPVKKGASKSNLQSDGISIPNHGSDFLIIHSSIPGFTSLRNEVEGSWLVQAFCAVIQEEKYKDDFLSLLTEVGRVIAEKEGTIRDWNHDVIPIKQMSCLASMLTRKIKFSKK